MKIRPNNKNKLILIASHFREEVLFERLTMEKGFQFFSETLRVKKSSVTSVACSLSNNPLQFIKVSL
jgi:hypothetical protein